MKKQITYLFTVVFIILMSGILVAQNAPIDFETGGHGADWTWTVFENDTNLPVEIVANPSATGINTSSAVAKITALTTGQPWVGCESLHGSDIGTFTLDATNSTVKIMVYKSVISDVAIKFAKADGWAMGEIKVANTVVNEWEELTFDLSSRAAEGYDQIIIFPDFNARTTENIVYFDNVTFSEQIVSSGPTVAAPTPTVEAADVNSIFSDAYTDIVGTVFNPDWGQSTVVTEVTVEGNATLLYTGLNYQGVVLGSTQDVSGMNYLHVDFWSTNSTALSVFLISETTGEQPYVFTMANDTWVGADIPLTAFTDLGLSIADIKELKFVGDGDVYLDNLYFYSEEVVVPGPHSPVDFEDGGNGADWTWEVFENDDNPSLDIIANPEIAGENTSATVAKFTAKQTGAAWAGCVTSDIGTFTLDATNSTVKIMVWKTVISDVGIKFEAAKASTGEIKVANTLVNQWEELTFDFSGKIGEPSSTNIDAIVIFPDFNARVSENIIYFDNVTFSEQEVVTPSEPTVAAPTPTDDAANVISIFSDVYTDVEGTNFDPDWGQATDATEVMIEGNATLKYANLNYQGTDFGDTLDVSWMDNLHVDYWTADATALQLFLISETSGEKSFDFTITTGSWVSVDIPLSVFTDQGLSIIDIYQFKFVGNGTVYLDNLYFSVEAEIPIGPNVPIDFETGGHGADWTWTVFENDTNLPVEIVANPSATGINTSSTVAKITALTTGQPWVGCESLHGSDIGTFNLDSTNSTVKIMVYKSVISDVAIKFAKADGWAMAEIKVANTVVNEWEELTFDFSSHVTDGYDQIIIFPDFNARTTENVVYFDNVTFSEQGVVTPSEPTEAAPMPTVDAENVISIYSDAYTDVAGTDFNPNWGQATVASEVMIVGNATLKYANLNYQGTDFGDTLDVSVMDSLHVDYWTEDATALEVFLISEASGEKSYVFTLSTDSWNSVNIPLSVFTDQGLSINDIYQFKFVGNGTVYLDNLYFSGDLVSVEEIPVATPLTYGLGQNYPNPFNPSTTITFALPTQANVKLIVYNSIGEEVAQLLNGNISAGYHRVNFDASNLTSGMYFYRISAGNFVEVKKMMLVK